MILGVTASQQKGGSGSGGGEVPPTEPPVFGAATVVIPSTLTVGVPFRATYAYSNSLGILENNKPPTIEDCFISGSLVPGGTITFNIVKHKIYNGGTIAPTRFRLLMSTDMKQLSEVELYNGTNTTFVIPTGSSTKYLRLEAEPRQTGGGNLIGAIKKSAYTNAIGYVP